MRSFTEPPGLKYSTLASTVGARGPRSRRCSRTSGVLPISSTSDSRIAHGGTLRIVGRYRRSTTEARRASHLDLSRARGPPEVAAAAAYGGGGLGALGAVGGGALVRRARRRVQARPAPHPAGRRPHRRSRTTRRGPQPASAAAGRRSASRCSATRRRPATACTATATPRRRSWRSASPTSRGGRCTCTTSPSSAPSRADAARPGRRRSAARPPGSRGDHDRRQRRHPPGQAGRVGPRTSPTAVRRAAASAAPRWSSAPVPTWAPSGRSRSRCARSPAACRGAWRAAQTDRRGRRRRPDGVAGRPARPAVRHAQRACSPTTSSTRPPRATRRRPRRCCPRAWTRSAWAPAPGRRAHSPPGGPSRVAKAAAQAAARPGSEVAAEPAVAPASGRGPWARWRRRARGRRRSPEHAR